MLKILADENMPYVTQLFDSIGQVTQMPGRKMTCDDLVDVDILLVRSITVVNQQLLAKANRLQFVGSATIGTDHIDADYLEQRGITWTNAPGCNATAVAEYVISALLSLSSRFQLPLQKKRVAIVGAGNIGQRLAKKLSALNIEHFFCDPPLQRAGVEGDFRDMNEVAKADIISLHVPIIKAGLDKTANLIDRAFIKQLKPNTILINSCRGDVVNNQDLLSCLNEGQVLHAVMDVWQNEPMINQQLVDKVALATPHIAGYSLEGKARGTYMLYQRWCQINQQALDKKLHDLLPPPTIPNVVCQDWVNNRQLSKLVKLVYDIRDDDDLCRHLGLNGDGFDNLRKQYGVRREFSALTVYSDHHCTVDLAQLGFNSILNTPNNTGD